MKTKSIKLSLAIMGMAILSSQAVSAQSVEEQMNRMYGTTVTARTNNSSTPKATGPKNAPGNMISEKQIYWFYLKNQHRDIATKKFVKFSTNDTNEVVSDYLKNIYRIDLATYNEFERRRILAKTKDEINAGIATLNYLTEYTKSVLVESIGEYSFTNHTLKFELRNNRSFLHKFNGLDFIAVNIPAVISHMYVNLNEADAEKVVTRLRGQDIGRNVAGVKYIKILPIAIEGKKTKYLLATESKTAFYYMEWEDGSWNYGDKIGESEWSSEDEFPHPEMQ
ncbi:hypothetical protein CJD36_016780 [Flavipsychrobacter stenotrophus]|uniref:Uncharacterized protein n=1 Tax=Flavipsychrobacter stenotrophus TaxID=2077091 RepID=A0A2S7SS67_9BACT|nr:hypothetical protein [Flavipsychrobacter stenotrophus]PQJ09594.1 hypothetical protein CJD36_016780 [Flavipsychrobacter stenotrophus]